MQISPISNAAFVMRNLIIINIIIVIDLLIKQLFKMMAETVLQLSCHKTNFLQLSLRINKQFICNIN